MPVDEVVLEHRLTVMETDLRRMADATEQLATHVKTQNGRIGKLEQRNERDDSYAAGKAALQKRDLALAGTTFTVIGILLTHANTVIGWFS